MVKNIASFNLTDNVLGTLETLSKQKGLSKSVLVERLLSIALRNEIDLTSEQRYHFSRNVIDNRCLDVLRLAGITMFEGGLSDKIVLICALQTDLEHKKTREIRNGIMKLSIFELLEDIKRFDKNVFDKTMIEMGRYRKLKAEYLLLYPI